MFIYMKKHPHGSPPQRLAMLGARCWLKGGTRLPGGSPVVVSPGSQTVACHWRDSCSRMKLTESTKWDTVQQRLGKHETSAPQGLSRITRRSWPCRRPWSTFGLPQGAGILHLVSSASHKAWLAFLSIRIVSKSGRCKFSRRHLASKPSKQPSNLPTLQLEAWTSAEAAAERRGTTLLTKLWQRTSGVKAIVDLRADKYLNSSPSSPSTTKGSKWSDCATRLSVHQGINLVSAKLGLCSSTSLKEC